MNLKKKKKINDLDSLKINSYSVVAEVSKHDLSGAVQRLN